MSCRQAAHPQCSQLGIATVDSGRDSPWLRSASPDIGVRWTRSAMLADQDRPILLKYVPIRLQRSKIETAILSTRWPIIRVAGRQQLAHRVRRSTDAFGPLRPARTLAWVRPPVRKLLLRDACLHLCLPIDPAI